MAKRYYNKSVVYLNIRHSFYASPGTLPVAPHINIWSKDENGIFKLGNRRNFNNENRMYRSID